MKSESLEENLILFLLTKMLQYVFTVWILKVRR